MNRVALGLGFALIAAFWIYWAKPPGVWPQKHGVSEVKSEPLLVIKPPQPGEQLKEPPTWDAVKADGRYAELTPDMRIRALKVWGAQAYTYTASQPNAAPAVIKKNLTRYMETELASIQKAGDDRAFLAEDALNAKLAKVEADCAQMERTEAARAEADARESLI